MSSETRDLQGSVRGFVHSSYLAVLFIALGGAGAFSSLGTAAETAVRGGVFSGQLAVTSSSEAGLLHGAAAMMQRIADVADGQLARAFPSRLLDSGDVVFDLGRTVDESFPTDLIDGAHARLLSGHPDNDPALVLKYAQNYADLQHRFNGAVPTQTLIRHPKYSKQIKGQLPYWDVDPSVNGVDIELFGLADASAFVEGDKVRLFAHYYDPRRVQALNEALGVDGPTDYLSAEMTSSYRSLMVYPDDGVPYMLKLPGTGDKTLPPNKVALSVERTMRFQNLPYVTPEYAGMAARANGQHFTAIQRKLPLPERALREGDVLISAHVLQAPEFWETDLGTKILGNYETPEDWYRAEVMPALGDDVYTSTLDAFAYLEYHTQNTDFFINAEGHVEEVFVKDVLDVMHDPALEAASGRTPLGTPHIRDVVWKNIGESNAGYTPKKFHRAYLGQLGLPGYRGYNSEHSARYTRFHAWMRDHVVERFLGTADEGELAPYGGASAVVESNEPLYETIASIREVMVLSGINKRFVADGAVSSHFAANAGGTPVRPVQRVPSGLGDAEYGFVGEVPVMVRRGPGGEVRDYEFRFK